jgi:hypothetical protein
MIEETILDTLPNKPSELLALALADLEQVENDPNYRVTMGLWHQPDGCVCCVCLAGSVLAKTCKVPPSKYIDALWLRDALYAKMYALDSFRVGRVLRGLRAMLEDQWGPADEERYKGYEQVVMCDYHTSPELFKNDIRRLIKRLQGDGL